MLNHQKVIQALQTESHKLFIDLSHELEIAQKIWLKCLDDPLLGQKVAEQKAKVIAPGWKNNIADKKNYVPEPIPDYAVFSVDGSQIYPDKHQGTSCALINIGSAYFNYSKGAVSFTCEPYLYFTQEEHETVSIDSINCERQTLEFKTALELATQHIQDNPVLLFDGSLIFWHLEGKKQELQEKYVHDYIKMLHEFYNLKILIAGYISLPQSKDLVNIIRAYILSHNLPHQINNLIDGHIIDFYLDIYERTALFTSNTSIVDYYPPHLKPSFFYLKLPSETVRIEIPAWIAQDPSLLESLTARIIDQTVKGSGYPVCLAEAHEQAVVKGPDRELFYQSLQRIAYLNNQRLQPSQKSLKKKGIWI